MKKTLCLILCIIMLCPFMFSCTNDLVGDGATFYAYVASETFCFDPALASPDDNTAQYLSLIYEGLTRIDAKGKLNYALLDHYTYSMDKIRSEYKLTLYLKHTKWSDASAVTADDLLYAWKRILSADFDSSAASLLYDIKNARTAKEGNCSIDDVGIASVDTYTLEVTFEYDINVDAFLRTCASLQLVPLRENVISRNPVNWAKRFSTLSVNGPFAIKAMDYGTHTLTLQRNQFYYLQKDEVLNKYVEPYKIIVNFVKTDDTSVAASMTSENLQAQLDKYLAGEILYIGDLPVSQRKAYESKGTVKETLSTMSTYINCNNELLSNADVRKALSLAVDRKALADKIVFADAATGLVNNLVQDVKTSESFRKAGGELVSKTADVAAAKALLSKAGVNGGSFTLTYKLTEEFAEVANLLKSNWEQLGFTVTLKPVMAEQYIVEQDDGKLTYYNDLLHDNIASGEYDVALCDFSMISTDPFGVLAQFAYGFTGNSCDAENDWAITGHVSGFESEAFNTAIENAFAEKDYAKRISLLHDAEKALLDEMPIIPLLFNKSFSMVSDELSDISVDYFGLTSLKSAYYKNFTEETEG